MNVFRQDCSKYEKIEKVTAAAAGSLLAHDEH